MPCGKERSPRIAIGRKLLTEEPSCEAVDMTALETFTTASKPPLTTGRQWYGPRPPGAGYHQPLAASRENCHANRSHWLGPGEICLRDSWRRRAEQDGAAQDASPSRRVNVLRQPAAVPCRHGGLERRPLLGAGAFRPWSRRPTDQSAVRHALCEPIRTIGMTLKP